MKPDTKFSVLNYYSGVEIEEEKPARLLGEAEKEIEAEE